MPSPHRTWLPIGLAAVATLFINVAVLSATTLPISAATSSPTATQHARADAAVPAGRLTVAATHSPVDSYRADGMLELDVIAAARLTAHQHLHAAADSAARVQAQRAAEQAASEQAASEQAASERATSERATAELPATPHTHEPAPTPTSAPADDNQARAERAADAMPFDWSRHGITFKVGCHPDQSRCAWGTFDYRVDEVWLSSAAFASDARLRYVVAHELAHAWQWSTDDLDDRKADLTDFGIPSGDGIEYGADCVAKGWGHPVATYWDCPSDAVAHMRSVFAANA